MLLVSADELESCLCALRSLYNVCFVLPVFFDYGTHNFSQRRWFCAKIPSQRFWHWRASVRPIRHCLCQSICQSSVISEMNMSKALWLGHTVSFLRLIPDSTEMSLCLRTIPGQLSASHHFICQTYYFLASSPRQTWIWHQCCLLFAQIMCRDNPWALCDRS